MSTNNCEVSIEEVGGNITRLIKKFSKKVKKLGILEEVRDRMYYTKPSKIRRKKRLNKQRLSRQAKSQ